MRGFNRVILAGNLTRDPEMRYTPKGLAIASFGLAVNRSWKDAETGELKEEVTFVDIDIFGKSAEAVAQYMKKGRPILIEGRLKLDSWDDKQTQQKRSKLKVVAESFQFLGDRQDGASGGIPSEPPRAAARPAPSAPAAPSEPESMPPEDDDVPF